MEKQEGGGNLTLKEMSREKEITENTECWICHRKAKEIKNTALDAYGSSEAIKDYGWESVMSYCEVLETDVPVCIVCRLLIESVSREALELDLAVGTIEEIATERDLKKLKIVYKE